ncbi:MAG: hypothetical protein WBX19_21620 [Terracidiphilus sp.]
MIRRKLFQMAGFGETSFFAAGLLAIACTAPAAKAATAPADPCSLLTAAQVSSAMGATYSAPQKTVAPRPYANTVQGTDCTYSGGGDKLLFRIYFDPSPADATDLFAKLKMFYSPPTPVPNLGDEAYFDPRHGIHVRKGNVRFFLSGGDDEKPLTALATQVAGQL